MLKKILKKLNSKLLSIKFHTGKFCHFGFAKSIIGSECVRIGDNFSIDDGFMIQAWQKYNNKKISDIMPSIIFGSDISIMSNFHISCIKSIYIEDGCLFGDNVFICDNFHGSNSFNELMIEPIKRDLFSKGPIHIGKNVWLGRNVCVMPNVTIGDYAVVGANAVVTHDLPPYSISAGSPAKIIKMINE